MAETQRHAEFPATKWSVIQRATAESSAASQAALEDLCRVYWPPLYAFVRRSGQDSHQAKDLVQGYLARLIQRQDLASVAPQKGRFRSYLLAGLRNFLVVQGSFYQYGGALDVELAGHNPGQFGQVSVARGFLASSGLNVVLANGYQPVVGDQFQILPLPIGSLGFARIRESEIEGWPTGSGTPPPVPSSLRGQTWSCNGRQVSLPYVGHGSVISAPYAARLT